MRERVLIDLLGLSQARRVGERRAADTRLRESRCAHCQRRWSCTSRRVGGILLKVAMWLKGVSQFGRVDGSIRRGTARKGFSQRTEPPLCSRHQLPAIGGASLTARFPTAALQRLKP